MEHLDTIEAVPEGLYYRQKVLVVNEEGDFLEVDTYRTTDPRGPFKPAKSYVELILEGATLHNLPEDYIKKIKKFMD